jgi:hypothetical protein
MMLYMLQWFTCMLQASVPNVSSAFQTYIASVLIQMLHLFHTYVARVCSKMLRLFQSYVAIRLFILQVASVLFGCCICFTHMLEVYVSNVSSASNICCIQMFHVASLSCFRSMFRESWGHGPSTEGRGVARRGPIDGACLCSSRPRVSPTRRERRGSGGRSGERGVLRDGRGRGTCAWWDEADGEGLQRYGGSAASFC